MNRSELLHASGRHWLYCPVLADSNTVPVPPPCLLQPEEKQEEQEQEEKEEQEDAPKAKAAPAKRAAPRG